MYLCHIVPPSNLSVSGFCGYDDTQYQKYLTVRCVQLLKLCYLFIQVNCSYNVVRFCTIYNYCCAWTDVLEFALMKVMEDYVQYD